MGPHPVRDILVESVCLDTYFGLLALVRISGWDGLGWALGLSVKEICVSWLVMVEMDLSR